MTTPNVAAPNGFTPEAAVTNPAAPDPNAPNSATELKSVLAEYGKAIAPLVELAKVKPSDPMAASELERLRTRLPTPEILAETMRTLGERLQGALSRIAAERAEAFGRWEATVVGAARERNESVKEGENAWRIGALELGIDRARARARVSYNQEEVVSWTPVDGAPAIEGLLAKAGRDLERHALSDEQLVSVFWTAYDAVRARHARAGIGSPELVPLPEFQREVRVELVRADLTGGSGAVSRRIKHVEMPQWAFLHALDRYRKLAVGVPAERRLAFQTGGQAEAREYAMVLGGLDANVPYRKYCYVRPAQTGGEE